MIAVHDPVVVRYNHLAESGASAARPRLRYMGDEELATFRAGAGICYGKDGPFVYARASKCTPLARSDNVGVGENAVRRPRICLEMTVPHPFDEATALVLAGDDVFSGAVSPAYANMVGPFGGITNAIMLNAAMLHRDRAGEPVALTVNFTSPIAAGSFEVRAAAVRTNRSTQHWSMSLLQAGAVAATATAVFAQRRETWSAPEAAAPGDLPSPGDLPRAPLAGLPAWVRRYDLRFVSGGLPDALDGREQADSRTVCWIRDEPARPLGFTSLASIADSFFPRIFVRRRLRSPVGTISLTTYFHADAALLARQADRHVIGVARAVNFRNGYFEQHAEIWSDAGQLLASSQQLVYYRS